MGYFAATPVLASGTIYNGGWTATFTITTPPSDLGIRLYTTGFVVPDTRVWLPGRSSAMTFTGRTYPCVSTFGGATSAEAPAAAAKRKPRRGSQAECLASQSRHMGE